MSPSRKHIVFVQQGMQPHGRYSKLAATLGAELTVCTPSNLPSLLSEADLAILPISTEHVGATHELESVLRDEDEVALLLVVESSALASLRLPVLQHVDFVVADASDEELAVRMRQLLRPGEEVASSDIILIDSMVVNLSTYQVLVDGVPIDFTYLEYALLAFLVTHPGHAYSRGTLLSRVWGFDYYGGSRTVDVHVRRVRAKLGSELAAHLQTVRGVGYMWQ